MHILQTGRLAVTSCATSAQQELRKEIWKMKTFDWGDPLREEIKNTCIELLAVIETLKYVEFPPS